MHTGLPVFTTSPLRSNFPSALLILKVTMESLSSFATKMKRWVGSIAKKRGVLPWLSCQPTPVIRPVAASATETKLPRAACRRHHSSDPATRPGGLKRSKSGRSSFVGNSQCLKARILLQVRCKIAHPTCVGALFYATSLQEHQRHFVKHSGLRLLLLNGSVGDRSGKLKILPCKRVI